MQDTWTIHLKNVSTAYTLSIPFLYDILVHSGSGNEIIQFRDLISHDQKSGIVQIILQGDTLGIHISKILEMIKWLDLLIFYSLPRHIDVITSILPMMESIVSFGCKENAKSFKALFATLEITHDVLHNEVIVDVNNLK